MNCRERIVVRVKGVETICFVNRGTPLEGLSEDAPIVTDAMFRKPAVGAY